MFRRTDPQTSLLESRFLIPPKKRARLERSWAQVFRDRILPAIDEEIFRDGFHAETGRPNTSIRLLTGLLLLKEWNDLTDEQVIENLEFNILWQHALGVQPRDAHTCQKTLHNFRVRLMDNDRAQQMFNRVTERLVAADTLSVRRQRIDSTHVMSNIKALTRLGLFVQTITHFLSDLKRKAPDKLEDLNAGYNKRYIERTGYFADARKEQARRRLPIVAKDLHALILAFDTDKDVKEWTSYGLMVRLFDDQCLVVDGDDGTDGQDPATSDDDRVTISREENPANSSDDGLASSENDGGTSNADDDPATNVDDGGTTHDDEGVTTSADDKPATSQDDGGTNSSDDQPQFRLKKGKEISGGSLQSPHDPDASYGHKGKGYEAQLAETCVDDNPYQVVTALEVNGANESDQHALLPIIDDLRRRGLGPDEMLADTSYGSGENIVQCAERGVELVAPVQDPKSPARPDPWQQPVESSENEAESEDTDAAPAMLGLDAFTFTDTFDQVRACPAGHAPVHNEVQEGLIHYKATFDGERCAGCPFADRCPTRVLASGDRSLQWRDSKAATARRQHEQREPDFKERYRLRSGIEATASEFKCRHGARTLRVRGRRRLETALRMKALSMNVKRAVQYHTRQRHKPGSSLPASAAAAR